MTNNEALEVLRMLVYDGYRLFECQQAWQTLNTAVLGTTPNNARAETVRCGIKLRECYSYCRDHCERGVCEYQERTASPVA